MVATAVREAGAGDSLAIMSTWVARAGHEREFEALAAELMAAAARVPGHLNGTVLHDHGSPEYHFVHSWRSGADVEQWHASSERDALLERLAVVADRRSRPERVTGLETWFTAGADGTATIKPPPRWKMWLASFLGAYPLVVLFQWLLAPTLEDVPLLLRSAIFPLVLLSLMTFFVMPFVTRMLHGWLFPHGPHG